METAATTTNGPEQNPQATEEPMEEVSFFY